jgi:hypothetical protein
MTHVSPTTWLASYRTKVRAAETPGPPITSRGRLPHRVHLRRGMRLRGRIRMPRAFRHEKEPRRT